MKRLILAVGLALAGAQGAWAGWPYATEPAQTLPQGAGELSVGVSQTWQDSSDLPGGRGQLWRLPEAEARLGVGPHAEVSANYEVFWLQPSDGGDAVYDSGDVRLWTKLTLLPAYLRGVAVRFGVKLPNAANEHGLGTDEADVFLMGLYDFQVGGLEGTVNLGLGILGDPEHNSAQNDVLTWAGSLRAPLPRGFRLGGEASGWADGHHQPTTFALVLDWTWQRWRLSLAGRRGVRDALSWGEVVGVTYTW